MSELPAHLERVHMVGIGGAGMSGIARILLARGGQVSGSDAKESRGVLALRARGAEVLGVPGGRPDLRLALEALLPRGVSSLLLEGGGTLAWGFLASALIDRVAWFVAPKLIGGAGTPGPLAGPGVARIDDAVRLEDLTTQLVGDDLLVMGRPRYPGSDQR